MRLLPILFLFINICTQGVKAQDYYSALTLDTTPLLIVTQTFSFNDNLYLLGYNTSEWQSTSTTSFISRINDDGSVNKLVMLDSLHPGRQGVIVKDSSFIVAGTEGNKIRLIEINRELQISNIREHTYNGEVSYFRIWDFYPYGNHFVLLASPRSSNSPPGLMFWVNRVDLDLDSTFIFDDTFNRYVVCESRKNTQNELVVFTQADTAFGKMFFEFRKFNTDMQLLDHIRIPFDNFPFITEFLILPNGNFVIEFLPGTLFCFTPEGDLVWTFNYDDHVDSPEHTLAQIAELKLTSEGDILACGTVELLQVPIYEHVLTGHAFKINANGELIWRRVYYEYYDGKLFRTAGLTDIQELDDGTLLIAGRAEEGFLQVAGESNYFWILHTDEDGCVKPDCGEEQLLPIVEVDHKKEKIFQILANPAYSSIQITGLTQEIFEMHLISPAGNILLSRIVDNSGMVSISTFGVPPGIYYLQASYLGRVVQTEKILVLN